MGPCSLCQIRTSSSFGKKKLAEVKRKSTQGEFESVLLGQKIVVLFPKIGRVKRFLSLTLPHSRMCIRFHF